MGNGIGSWSGTAKGIAEESIFYDDLKNNSGFIFWHMILPTFVILLMYQRDMLKKMKTRCTVVMVVVSLQWGF